jgi:hypothetical protein
LELKSNGLENTRISRPKIKEKTETTKRKNGQEKKENRKEKSKQTRVIRKVPPNRGYWSPVSPKLGIR